MHDWITKIRAIGGPSDLEQKAMSKCKFIYSGGSRWGNIHSRVQGIDTPVHQMQGNLWKKVNDEIAAGTYTPEYVFVICSSNDFDKINDCYYDKLRNSPDWHILCHTDCGPSDFYKRAHNNWWDDRLIEPRKQVPFDQVKFMKTNIATLHESIKTVMKVLLKQYKGCKFYFLATIPRKNWFPAIKNEMPLLNVHMRTTYGMKVAGINGFLGPEHFIPDGVHLSSEGYKVFVSKGFGMLLDFHYKKFAEPKPKTSFDDMTKGNRRRLVRRLVEQYQTRINDK